VSAGDELLGCAAQAVGAQSVGTDIVSVARIERLLRERGDRFAHRWFTPAEVDYCVAKAVPSRHFAARFAGKEAVVKALPGIWTGPLPWRSIEILPQPTGAPAVRLYGAFAAAVRAAGVRQVQVSLSHCDDYATATALVSNR
jgi:holo-[acyl-carrier protein] synthase